MKTFETSNLGLAAYLLASKRLQFLGVDLGDSSHAEFRFDDPTGIGESLDLEFGSSDPAVGAVSFHRALRSLRHMIDRKRPNGTTDFQTIGKSNGNTKYHFSTR